MFAVATLAAGTAFLPPPQAAASTPTCANGSYLVSDGSLFQLDEQSSRARVVATIHAPVNALGYESSHGRFFAIASQADGSHIVAIDPAGGVTDLGPAPDGTGDAYAGAIANGRWYLHGRGDLVVVSVDPHAPDYLDVVTRRPLSRELDVGDWDVEPETGLLFGVEASGPDPGRLTTVNPATGKVSVVALAGVPGGRDFGAAVVDGLGTLHVLRNASGVMYHVPLDDPRNTTSMKLTDPARSVDAAGCPQAWDFGDAPVTYGTTLADDGPRHTVSTFDVLSIGETVDAEPDGEPSDVADTDTDDLEGPIEVVIGRQRVTVPVRNETDRPALLAGWLDLNGDGSFERAERASSTVAPGDTTTTVHWSRGVTTSDRYGFLRLRLYADASEDARPIGPATGGEIEDHRIRYHWPKATTTSAAQIPPTSEGPTPSPTTTRGSTSTTTPTTTAAPTTTPATQTSRTRETVDYVATPPEPQEPQQSSSLPNSLTVVVAVLVPAVIIAARTIGRAASRSRR
ncbi:MAG: hypothetical protein GEU97_23030 [Actinophytocola sp.]|nr:hypothetical protein [Actinophytocola sp.]